MIISPFPPRDSYCFPVHLVLSFENLALISVCWGMQVVGSYVCKWLNCQAGAPKIWLDRNVGCTPLVAIILPTVASSWCVGGCCLSLLSFVYFWEWFWILRGLHQILYPLWALPLCLH